MGGKRTEKTVNCVIIGEVVYVLERERDTNVQNMAVSPTSDGGQIHLNPSAI